MDLTKINFLQTINLNKFKNVMFDLYPSDSCKDLGRKYQQIGKNQFKNDYLRDVVQEKPLFNDYFKVFYSTEGELLEVIKDRIIANQDDYKCKDDFDWDKVFKVQTDNQLFYHILKKQKISKKEEGNKKKDGILKYFQLSGMDQILKAPNTTLLRYHEKTLFIFERKISELESLGLQSYLKIGAENQEMQIRTLIIDSCQMDDQVLSNVLQGILNQVLNVTEINKIGQPITYQKKQKSLKTGCPKLILTGNKAQQYQLEVECELQPNIKYNQHASIQFKILDEIITYEHKFE